MISKCFPVNQNNFVLIWSDSGIFNYWNGPTFPNTNNKVYFVFDVRLAATFIDGLFTSTPTRIPLCFLLFPSNERMLRKRRNRKSDLFIKTKCVFIEWLVEMKTLLVSRLFDVYVSHLRLDSCEQNTGESYTCPSKVFLYWIGQALDYIFHCNAAFHKCW